MPILLLSLLPGIAACCMENAELKEQHKGDLRAFPSPPGVYRHWVISAQAAARDGTRICTVSIDEIDITQRAYGDSLAVQVETSYPPEPGAFYTLIVNGHRYGIPNGYFNTAQSQRIIDDFSDADVLHIEWKGASFRADSLQRLLIDTLPLKGFKHEYNACTRSVLARAYPLQ